MRAAPAPAILLILALGNLISRIWGDMRDLRPTVELLATQTSLDAKRTVNTVSITMITTALGFQVLTCVNPLQMNGPQEHGQLPGEGQETGGDLAV